MRRPKSLLVLKLILLASSLAVAFGLVELSLWLAGNDIRVVWIPDRELGWRNLPGAHLHYLREGDGVVDINSLGNRDRERPLEKPPGTFRIAVFGDSMTEAVEVNLDQTFCYLMEERFKRVNAQVEVLNFGVIAYSPIQELLLFQREGPRHKPDLVVLALFIDNDVSGCRGDLAVVDGAPLVRTVGEGIQFDYAACDRVYDDYMREPIHFFRVHTRTYHFLNRFRNELKKRFRQKQESDSIPKRFFVYHDPLPAEWEDAWRILERVIVEFKREAEKQRVPMIVVNIPSALALNDANWNDSQRAHPRMASEKWNVAEPEQRLRRLLTGLKIPYIPLLEAMQASQSDEPLYFGNFGHLTPRGHVVVADTIAASLARRGMMAAALRNK